jgi:gamma-carbonic anhydrase
MTAPLIIPYGGKTPLIHESAFIAPGVVIIGDVEIGPEASIWYNCVIRADVNRIRIGARTNVQDGSVIHCDSPSEKRPEGFPTLIGDDVLIGHMALIHGCTVEDFGFVGMASVLMDGAVIESEGMLAAGAMLTPGKRIKPRELWAGRPAAYMRDLTDAALAEMRLGITGYVEKAGKHARALGALQDGITAL